MKPQYLYYEDELCSIYNADCRDQGIPRCDLLVTDPPYEQSNAGGGFIAKRSTFQQIGEELSSFEPKDYWELLSSNKHGYIFCSKTNLPQYCELADQDGLNWDILIYGKNNPIPMKNNRYLSSFEYIFFFRGKDCYWNNKAPFSNYSKIKMTNCVPSKFGHPTEKNVEILKEFITVSSKIEDIIFDPFMGSGSTLVAAKELGRKCIGVEINERYCEIAAKRLSDTDKINRLTFK